MTLLESDKVKHNTRKQIAKEFKMVTGKVAKVELIKEIGRKQGERDNIQRLHNETFGNI